MPLLVPYATYFTHIIALDTERSAALSPMTPRVALLCRGGCTGVSARDTDEDVLI